MRYYVLLAALVLINCVSGPPVPGKYAVTLDFTKDTFPHDDPNDTRVGTSSTVMWTIVKDSTNTYTLFVTGGGTFYEGAYDKERRAVLWHQGRHDSAARVTTESILEVRSKIGSGLTGIGVFNLTPCLDCPPFTIEANLNGRLIEKL